MEPTTTPITRDKARWGWLACALIAISLTGLIQFGVGCAQDTRYKVMSTFFDGVPDPNAPVVKKDNEDITINSSGVKVIGYTHKPFKENKCNACHESAAGGDFASYTRLDATVCMKCHSKVTTQYPVMHGSVAAGECLFCHNPHESSVPALLNRPAPAVCVQCHLPENLSARHAEYPKTQSCLECHYAHGAEKHGLLRSGVALAPTTLPASAAPNPGAAPTEGGAAK